MKKLYLVATPIGNLEDITRRAVRILGEADIIIAEDSRITSRLLANLGLKKSVYTFHERSKPEKIPEILAKVSKNGSAAVVTDAGTPGISDPGGRLVSDSIKNGFEVFPIPGPSAVTAALSVYGKRIPGFNFIGFFPKKGRTKIINEIKNSERPIVFFETAPRIKKTLNFIYSEIGDLSIVINREITKIHETIYRGKISELVDKVKERGEFVVVIQGYKEKSKDD